LLSKIEIYSKTESESISKWRKFFKAGKFRMKKKGINQHRNPTKFTKIKQKRRGIL